MPTCHRCKRPVRNMLKAGSRTYAPYDNGGKGFVYRSGGLVLTTIWLPHACGAPPPTNPIARAAETASEPDVRAAFAALAGRKA
jgi:hypothetical protein